MSAAHRHHLPSASRSGALPLQLWLLFQVLLAVPAISRAQALPSDAAQSTFPHRRSITVQGTPADGFAVVALPPELTSAAPDGSYRLIRSDEREVPYVVTRDVGESKDRRYTGELVDTRHESEQTVWVVDLGAMRRFESLDLTIPQMFFRRRVTVEASEQQSGPFHVIARDVGIFDLPWQTTPGGRLHYTTLRFPQSERARFLRFHISTRWRGFRALSLQAVTAIQHLSRPGSEWSMTVPLAPMPTPAGPKHAKAADQGHVSLYRVEVPPGMAFSRLAVSARDAGFVRAARVLEIDGIASSSALPAKLKVLTEGTLFRIAAGPVPMSAKKGDKAEPFDDEPVTGESLSLDLDETPGRGVIVLEVTDGDSPPLTELQATVAGYGSRLIFPLGPTTTAGSTSDKDTVQQYALYFGSESARPREYDLAKLATSLARLSTLVPARLGPKESNPRFQKAQPLPAVPTSGSPLQTSGFRLVRPLIMNDGVELYSLLLSPIDLAYLRPDLGDLRVADGSDQQVPYVLVPHALETRSELQVTPEPAQADKVSRFRLALRHDSQSLLVPLDAIELSVASSFYSRAVRVREVRTEATPYASVLCSATILRLSEEDAGLHRLPLPGHPVRELILEVDNGDNPPLELPQVLGVVAVPRVIYKADAQKAYRLLIGNPTAQSPSYDLASLRSVLIEYPSRLATLGELTPNPGFRPPGNYFQEGRMNLLLLGVLLLCVLVLLLLSLRLIRSPHPAPPAGSSEATEAATKDPTPPNAR
jgi:hypothetical protein